MNYKEYLLLAVFGLLSTFWKVLSYQDIDARKIGAKVILSIVLSVGIVPAIMEYYQLSITIGIGLSVFVTMFSESLIELIQKKIAERK